MILNILIASAIGGAIGLYGGFIVEYIYRFKDTPKASIVRILGVSSGAVIAPCGDYFVKNFLHSGLPEEDIYVDFTYMIMGLIIFVLSLYLRRHKIG